LQTYNDIYLDARKRLKAEGVEAFAPEARLIVSAAAGKTVEQLTRDLNLYVSADFSERVESYIARRLAGEPVAYITGEWEFYGMMLNVTPDVLIPRTDTEVLVDKAIEMLRGREENTRVLDLCCGSGCIGLAVAENVRNSRVILVDKSLKALRVARSNVLKNNLTRSVTCIDADACAPPPVLLGSFDMLLCNPPYIPSEDILGLDPSVRDYEPVEALDGGPDGLDFYPAVTRYWRAVLRDRGCLMFEVGIGQAAAVKQILEDAGFAGVQVFQDTLGIDRVVAGIHIAGGENNG